MSYPSKPIGDNILPFDTLFANNNSSKTAMTTNEILDGYNNDGDAETSLTSRPDANRFNMFWYQVHNTIKWVVEFIEELYMSKLETSGGTMTGILSMGNKRITNLATPSANSDATTKQYVDTAINANSMWIGEIKTLSYPRIPELPSGVEIVPCDGRAISRTQYSELFNFLGTAFGSGNGSTTFNIPDYRGCFLRGWDGGSNRDKGRIYGTIQNSAAPNIWGRFYNSQESETSLDKGCYGAFSRIQTAGNGVDGTHGWFEIVDFQAYRCSSVYQSVDEVRPINANAYYVIRIK